MKNSLKRLVTLFLIPALMLGLFLTGCGGNAGGSNPANPPQTDAKSGTVKIKVKFPEADKRFIPSDTTQIDISISGENLSAPITGQLTPANPEISFPSIPAGDKTGEFTARNQAGTIVAHRKMPFYVTPFYINQLEVNLGVTINDDGFIPQTITVNPGTTLLWRNNGSSPHSLESLSQDSPFDNRIIESGDSASYTFDNFGTFQYRDGQNPSLTGTVIVANTYTPQSAWNQLNAGNFERAGTQFNLIHQDPAFANDPSANLGYLLTVSLVDLKNCGQSMQDNLELGEYGKSILAYVTSGQYPSQDVVARIIKNLSGEYLPSFASSDVNQLSTDLAALKEKLSDSMAILDLIAQDTDFRQTISYQGLEALKAAYDQDAKAAKNRPETYYFTNQHARILKGLMLGLRSWISVYQAYDWNYGSFDQWMIDPNESDGQFRIFAREGLPPAPFATLKTGGEGADLMSQAGEDLSAMCDEITSALDEMLDEHDPNVPNWDQTNIDQLNLIKSYLADLKASLSSPTPITYEDGKTAHQVTLDLSKFYENPIIDLTLYLPGREYQTSGVIWGPEQALVDGKPTFHGIFPQGLDGIQFGPAPRWSRISVIPPAEGSGTYDVWGGNTPLGDPNYFYFNIGRYYTYLGEASSTETFFSSGSYQYYVITCPDHNNPVKIDAVYGHQSNYDYFDQYQTYCYSDSTRDCSNAGGGVDDNLYAELGVRDPGSYDNDGYLVIKPQAEEYYFWWYITVITPPEGTGTYQVWGGNDSYLPEDAAAHYLNLSNQNYGYVNLGQGGGQGPSQFEGAYNYYVIAAPDSQNPALIDAVQGTGNTYANRIEDTGNTENHDNALGEPNDSYARVGTQATEYPYSGFLVIPNPIKNNLTRRKL